MSQHCHYGLLCYRPLMTQAPKSHPSEDQSECLSAVKAGLRSLEAGQSVPYEKVRRWLLSWGTPSELSKPECV
ncbi:hypothetical protein [Asticcacaulis sp.]|uniref:hypothetical protein n=1 Tax=Asticcacaulis sp. TaxID=1872648 RepID=UPI0025BE50A0|nr:hypothetical protein [Asticcacaulis sp.]